MVIHYYIFPEGCEPLRLPKQLVASLVAGQGAIPQYAGTQQKIIDAVIQMDDGKPIKLLDVDAYVWIFDNDGRIVDGVQDARDLVRGSLRASNSGTVVELESHAKKRELNQKYRWDPGKSEINKIIADTWPKQKTDRLKYVKGVSKRKPPLTYDARHSLDEISSIMWKIPHQIGRLKEPSLRGFAFEARKLSEEDPDYPELYAAIADMADYQIELSRRKRTGKGIWYAVVNVMHWDDAFGQHIETHHQRCCDRKEAVCAARQLLTEYAPRLDHNITIETELLTDLEWQRRGESD